MQAKPFILAAYALLILSASCGDKPETTGNSTTAHPHNSTATHEEHSVSNTHNLALNNGAKWQTDASTRTHAAAIIAHVETFESTRATDLAAYHNLAQNAQGEIDGLIAGCRMKGAEHDALHLWLEPVMADVKSLQKTATLDDAKLASHKLSEDVGKFNQYFN